MVCPVLTEWIKTGPVDLKKMHIKIPGEKRLRQTMIGGGFLLASQAAFDDFRPICL
jgi:hypothetical protein